MQKQSRNPNSQLHGLILLMMMICFYIVPLLGDQSGSADLVEVDVGLILDMDDILGKMSRTCIHMALEDYYASTNHTTQIILRERNSKNDTVEAASAAIDLMKNSEVQAILGLQTCSQADFVIEIGKKSQVPVISSVASPSLSTKDNPYFIRGALNGLSQVGSLTAIVKAFGWREVVLIYEDTDYGRGIGPSLADSLLEVGSQIRYQSVLSPLATHVRIREELYKLMTRQTRVFVVHMLPSLASRFFKNAKKVGMMEEGYAWIITDGLTSRLNSLDPEVIGSMHGVIGVKPYVQNSSELQNFTERWEVRFRQDYPDINGFELNVLGLWAYDSATMLAMAVDRSGISDQSKFKKQDSTNNLTDLGAIGSSEMGPMLLQSIKNAAFKGLSGEFLLVDGQLPPLAFQIINIADEEREMEIGFWTDKSGISKELVLVNNGIYNYTTNKKDLGYIIWPGESDVVPRGWVIPTSVPKLRVGVPAKSGFPQLVKVERVETNAWHATGFCIDVFQEIMDHSLPYYVPYEFYSFERNTDGSYDDIVGQISLGNYDAVVGDVTILANRSRVADFTLPFMQSSVAMIVRIEDDERKNGWIFLKPLKMDLWLTTGAFFIFIGFVVWFLEHRVNEAFRGSAKQQVGTLLWFSFSTLAFAHREKVISNISRFVVIVWIFVVLVLTQSYTANLTSMLTVEKLQPTVTEIMDLKVNGDDVGCQNGTFVKGLLEKKGFNSSMLSSYGTFDEYDVALSTRSVAAIIDEVPYIKLFLAEPKYCAKYIMVGPFFETAGFGFAFPKGSPLVPDVSRAILEITEAGILKDIQQKYFGEKAECAEQDGARITSSSLNVESFKGLFLFAFVSSSFAIILFLSIFLYDNKVILASNNLSPWQKLIAMAKTFDKEKESTSDASKKTNLANEGMTVAADCAQSPATSDPRLSVSISVPDDEEFATTESNSPTHGVTEMVTLGQSV